MTLLFYQSQVMRSWMSFLDIRSCNLLHRCSLMSTSQKRVSSTQLPPPTTYIGRVLRDEPPKAYKYPDWNSLSRKEFWKQHEQWRLHRHFSERQHFIDYKHEQLLIYFCLVGAAGVFAYLFFGTYSFQDSSARIFKAIYYI